MRSARVSAAVVLIGVTVVLLGVPTGALAPSGAGSARAGPASSEPSSLSTTPAVSAATGILPSARAAIEARATSVGLAGGGAAAGLEPNIGYQSVREGSAIVPVNVATGQVSPGPTSIGVNDLGFRSTPGGNYVPYWYRTTSFDGTVTIDNMTLLPLETNVSDGITLQENAVIDNMTLFGQSIYQVWAQNVILYSVQDHGLQLLTDAWNFSSPYAQFFQNDIYENSPGGFLFTGTYVHQVPLTPPLFTVQMPFTMRFYMNTTNIDGRNALFFNYTLYSAQDIYLGSENLGTHINDGSFDWIIFNSTAGQPAGYTAPPMSFLVSGNESTVIGLPFDAEMAICGPSDGYSADIRSLTATAQLLYLDSATGTYVPVPAAFTTTEDTGESVEGVDAHFTAASAHTGSDFLTNGPEFVYGLWNASARGVTDRKYTLDLSPSTAQAWVSPDFGGPNAGFSNDSAAWSIAPGPDMTFWLPATAGQTYSVAVLANDYAPVYTTIAAGSVAHVAAPYDPRLGVYVPILAFGNAGVARIATGGIGTATDPYVLEYDQTGPISSLYGTFDIFTEPLYPGLLLSGVTAYVEIVRPPSLAIQYTAADLVPLVYYWGLNVPSTNNLPIEIYDSSHISILDASGITGWFPITLTGFLMASLFLSNDTHSLVAYDRFESEGSSMVIVEPNGNASSEQNTVFGDTFDLSPAEHQGYDFYLAAAFNTTNPVPYAPGGLGVFAAGNTIYDNLFRTPITAYSPPQNPFLAYIFVNDLGYADFAQVASIWHNAWNISREPATYVRVVNGIPLVGSIVGASFEGGNAWWNWNGSIPYTDGGLITPGGDYLPLPYP